MGALFTLLQHTVLMRHTYAHETVLFVEPDADERAPGAAVTAALCGHWDHEPPCPLAPHHVRAVRFEDDLHVRVLFAADPQAEGEVRSRIDRALSGQWEFPDGFTARWRLRDSVPSEVLPDEIDHAERLARM